MRDEPAVTDPIADELRLIRNNVPGVRGSITATTDGLLVAHDVHGLEPTQVAALVAAIHAVAARASLSTECGQLKEVITRGGDGYLAVYAAGAAAVVAVLGTTDLNVAMLNFQARKMIERIAEHSAGLARGPLENRPGVPASPRRGDEGRAGGEPLPARRPRAG
jgi:predicted regulator of Ras-like GTPase activity (Roadblock/LC7/MglB family)